MCWGSCSSCNSAAAVAVTPQIISDKPSGVLLAPDTMTNIEKEALMDEWKNYNGELVCKSDMDEANKRLIEIFEEDPDLVEIFKDINSGSTFREALSKHFEI